MSVVDLSASLYVALINVILSHSYLFKRVLEKQPSSYHPFLYIPSLAPSQPPPCSPLHLTQAADVFNRQPSSPLSSWTPAEHKLRRDLHGAACSRTQVLFLSHKNTPLIISTAVRFAPCNLVGLGGGLIETKTSAWTLSPSSPSHLILPASPVPIVYRLTPSLTVHLYVLPFNEFPQTIREWGKQGKCRSHTARATSSRLVSRNKLSSLGQKLLFPFGFKRT